MIAGAAIPLAVLGLTDWFTWSVPFGSIINNFRANIIEARSHTFGVSPAYWYLRSLASSGVGRPSRSVCSRSGARVAIPCRCRWRSSSCWYTARSPTRNIASSTPQFRSCSLGIAGLGRTVYMVRVPATWPCWRDQGRSGCWPRVAHDLRSPRSIRRHATAMVSRSRWSRTDVASKVRSQMWIALLGISWFWTGGYTSLHEHIPIHQLVLRTSASWDTNAFDAWIAPQSANEPPAAGFTLNQCMSRICLWTRNGPCHRARWTKVQNVMEARGE